MTEFLSGPSSESPPPAGPPPYFPPPGSDPARSYPNNRRAVTSMSMGAVGLITAPFLVGLGLGIAAVVTGVSARRRVQRGEATDGGGIALVGIVLGILATLVGLAVCVIIAIGIATDQFNEDYQHCLGYHNGMSEYCKQYR